METLTYVEVAATGVRLQEDAGRSPGLPSAFGV